MISHKGTSIIEIIIAAALICISILAALSLINRSQKQNTYAKNLAEATKYNTQAAEWLRTEWNSLGWATMINKIATTDGSGSTYCLNILPNITNASLPDFISLTPGLCADNSYITGTIFQRTINAVIDPNNPNKLKIKITVTWSDTIKRQATTEMELARW